MTNRVDGNSHLWKNPPVIHREVCNTNSDSVVHRQPTPALCGHVGAAVSLNEQRDFRPFIPECTKRGIGKTKAYELANAGLLETFPIGSKRYVYLDSLLSLPARLAAANDTEAGK